MSRTKQHNIWYQKAILLMGSF